MYKVQTILTEEPRIFLSQKITVPLAASKEQTGSMFCAVPSVFCAVTVSIIHKIFSVVDA